MRFCTILFAIVFAAHGWNASAQSQYRDSSDFAHYAMKLRENQLIRINPNVVTSPTKTVYSGSGSPYASRNRSVYGNRSVFYGNRSGMRILMIGDSLTVGGFGESMQNYLVRRFGRNRVALYASCGSSPEQWLRSEPEFRTRCGYREETPQSSILYDFENGRAPQPALTPKLEGLVAQFHPTTVIVQLGTNWMDEILSHSAGQEATYDRILDRFVAAIRSEPHVVRQIIWITPPDSSRYSSEVKRTVATLIKGAARKYLFETIDSSVLTHYVPGRSGGDGVHYNSEEAKKWGAQVTRQLDRMLR